MTLHSVLIEIQTAGARGASRDRLVKHYGWNVMWAIDHLLQLGLILRSNHSDWRYAHYFATLDRGLYPRTRVDA